ncbi:hypothetical protein Chor_002030 [Crotalus horridus]
MRRQSGAYEPQSNTLTVTNCVQDRESPDGGYTEEPSQESDMKTPTTEFDDEFDDEEPLPTIGTCKALYTFEGQNEGTISVTEGETLYVIEEDKGDGLACMVLLEDPRLEKNAKDVPLQLGNALPRKLEFSRHFFSGEGHKQRSEELEAEVDTGNTLQISSLIRVDYQYPFVDIIAPL